MTDEQYALIDSLVMENRDELAEWRQPRMGKGYSFEYVKSKLFGVEMNTAIKCIEDGQYFYFRWKAPQEIKEGANLHPPTNTLRLEDSPKLCAECGLPEGTVQGPWCRTCNRVHSA